MSRSTAGLAIAVGSLLDGTPESVAIGLTMIGGGAVSTVAVIAIFLSNIPEGLSSAGMRRAGRSKRCVFGLWTVALGLGAVAAFVGFAVFAGLITVLGFLTALVLARLGYIGFDCPDGGPGVSVAQSATLRVRTRATETLPGPSAEGRWR